MCSATATAGSGCSPAASWDACVDVSGYLPRLVGDAVHALGDRAGRYVYVSTISVYADLSVPRDEGGPLATLEDESTETIDGGTYGALKALCERRVTDVLGERAVIVRPGYVIGPHDHTGRFPWWAHRAARGGEMIVPASFARAFQAIDARDLGDFLLLGALGSLAGVFNVTGPVPPVTMVELVEVAARLSGAALRVEVVDDVFLAAERDRVRAAALAGGRPAVGRMGCDGRLPGARGGASLPRRGGHGRGDARRRGDGSRNRARAGARVRVPRSLALALTWDTPLHVDCVVPH